MYLRERQRLWRLYQRNLSEGRQFSLRDWGLPLGQRAQQGFVPSGGQTDSAAQRVVENLLVLWETERALDTERAEDQGKDLALTDGPDDSVTEQKVVQLCLDFLTAVDRVNQLQFDQLMAAEIPVNFQHPQHLETALHIACSRPEAAPMVETLLERSDIDLLLRDRFGRQAWNNATFFGIDPALTERVVQATEAQAKEEMGLETFYQDYRTYLAQWMDQPWYQGLTRFVDYD